jgi:predicted TIM-barrel fold metal-dependent hydrolase
MNRRSFLAAAGLARAGLAPAAMPAGKASAAAPTYDVLAEIRRYRKIDSHNHIFQDPGAVIAAADRLYIEKIAVSAPNSRPDKSSPEAIREANDRVLKAMREFPGRFLGQCAVNPAHGQAALDEMMRCIDSGMVGLGEMYTQVRLTDPRYVPLIEKSIELKAPLMSHAGASRKDYRDPKLPGASNADDFAEIGKRYPELMLIYGHIGGGGDWEYACKALRAAPTVYADTSGSVTDEGMVDFAVECLGVNRLIFATDMNFETGVGKILAARLTEQQRRQIFFENYNNLLRKRGNHAH